ncbi:MAG: hypothetical protein H0X36_03875 [Sphingomonadaceae bacterium]|nr:hypothetical protein [Sphingomonadaceae bacterium]
MTANPYDFWLGMWRTGMRLTETMHASGAVIDSRSRAMMDAARDPLNGDYRELNRMLPEKVAAFSQAGASLAADFWALQTQAMANWSQMMTLAMNGRGVSLRDWMAMASRSSAMMTRTGRSGAKALAPVHRAATANARRLKRT